MWIIHHSRMHDDGSFIRQNLFIITCLEQSVHEETKLWLVWQKNQTKTHQDGAHSKCKTENSTCSFTFKDDIFDIF